MFQVPIRVRWSQFKENREDYSLWIFPRTSKVRIFCCNLTEKAWFDFIILIFIAANCITLAMERPNIPPDSSERKILNHMNRYIICLVQNFTNRWRSPKSAQVILYIS